MDPNAVVDAAVIIGVLPRARLPEAIALGFRPLHLWSGGPYISDLQPLARVPQAAASAPPVVPFRPPSLSPTMAAATQTRYVDTQDDAQVDSPSDESASEPEPRRSFAKGTGLGKDIGKGKGLSKDIGKGTDKGDGKSKGDKKSTKKHFVGKDRRPGDGGAGHRGGSGGAGNSGGSGGICVL